MAVLLASLMGSGHCVAMCGGLVLATVQGTFSWISFQLGRLAGYLFLGGLVGWLGGKLLNSNPHELLGFTYLSWGSSIFIALLFLISGTRLWQDKSLHFSFLPKFVLSWIFKRAGKRSGLVGLLTAFLPCGWLHTFLLAAMTTQSLIQGAGLLFAFWLGTLPALGLAPWIVKRFVHQHLALRSKIAAILLLSAGILSVGLKIFPTLPILSHSNKQHSCH